MIRDKCSIMNILREKWGVGIAVSAISIAAHAQGVLTVTPGRSTATAVGVGTLGYTGDNTAASNAALASPSAIAYDANGNLYLADSNNHVIREVLKSNGAITTIAGTGIAGFSGDGGVPTAAQLDTPTGIALDSSAYLLHKSSCAVLGRLPPRLHTSKASTGWTTRGFRKLQVFMAALGEPQVCAGRPLFAVCRLRAWRSVAAYRDYFFSPYRRPTPASGYPGIRSWIRLIINGLVS